MKEIDEQIKQEIFYEKYRYISIEKFDEIMKDLYNKIIIDIQSKKYHNNRTLKKLLKDIKKEIDSIYSSTKEKTQVELENVIGTFLISESKLLNTKLDTSLLDQVFNFENDFVQGYTFSELFQLQSEQSYHRIKKILAVNLLEGKNPAEFSDALYKAQITLSKAQMYTAVRTYAKTLREKTRDITENNISDMKGRMSLATLDSRTTPICIQKDKEFYSIQKYKNRNDIPNRPPRHFNCRSILVRITEKTTSFTRAANGDKKQQVDTRTTFNSFLKRNPKTARKLLGEKRYNLFKTGKYNIKDFISDNGVWINIEDLKKL